MHLPLASKPHPAKVCAAGAGWAVLVGYMRVPTVEQNLALYHQYGNQLYGTNFWKQVTDGDWQGAYKNLIDLTPASSSTWS